MTKIIPITLDDNTAVSANKMLAETGMDWCALVKLAVALQKKSDCVNDNDEKQHDNWKKFVGALRGENYINNMDAVQYQQQIRAE